MIRYAYNNQVQPAAPFVLVTLQHPTTGAKVADAPAQLDTAADRTLLPLAIAQALQLPAIGSVPIGGVGGTITTMPCYAVLLGVHTLAPRLIEVLAHPDESWVLLGRDVLNHLRLILDGPQLVLQID